MSQLRIGGGANARKPIRSVVVVVPRSGVVTVIDFSMIADGGNSGASVLVLYTFDSTCGNAGPAQPAAWPASTPATSNAVCVTCARYGSP